MSEAHDSSGGANLGARLAEARQAQSLATADVARRLKLSVGQVEALEAGRFHDLPGPIFVRGFIRNYAKLVRLDPDELLQAAAESLPQPASRPEVPPSQDIPFPGTAERRWPQVAIGVAALVGLLAIYEFSYKESVQTVAPWLATQAPAAPERQQAKPVEPELPQETVSAQSGTPKATALVARHPAPAPATTASVPAAPAAPVPPVVVVSRQERPVHPDEREVRFVFEEESWVEVRDRNDTVIFYQLNASGTARRVSGLPPLSIVVGNANGVRMTYDGRPVDLARHTKIDVARVTLE